MHARTRRSRTRRSLAHALASLARSFARAADGKSAIDAVALGLDNLETIFTSIGEKYAEDLAAGEYDTTEETFLDLASVKKLRTTGGGVDAEDVSMAEA